MDPLQLMSVVQYRCVCGNPIALISDAPRQCLGCGRHVPAGAFYSGDMTVIGDHPPPTAESSQPDPLLNQRLRHFRILSRLGRGGMGAVYRAVDESLERYVALKVIHPSQTTAEDSRQIERLLQEARAQARVCHPNVTQVYFVNHQDDAPFLAMELVPGESLEERLKSRRLTFAEVVEIARQTCLALRAAARFNIVHGDIKPANLLITPDGTVKLSDFGLARPVQSRGETSQGVAGTPNYLSPEACRGQSTDHRSDMYSLGVMLFEMTFGRLPYEASGTRVTARLRAHLDWPVDFPQPWPSGAPRAWKGLLARLLEKDPERRFRNFDELLAELQRLAPAKPPRAGRIVRSLAWASDLALLLCIMQLCQTAFLPEHSHAASAFARLAGAQLSAAALLVAAAARGLMGTSVGKKLFQLRVVDEHGHAPAQLSGFLRSLGSDAPLWGLIALRCGAALGWSAAAQALALTFVALSGADALLALLRPDARSGHDLLLGSRVALDAALTLDRPGLPSSCPLPAAETALNCKTGTRELELAGQTL
jgi:uncharacterized RDD family membrane protein YckC